MSDVLDAKDAMALAIKGSTDCVNYNEAAALEILAELGFCLVTEEQMSWMSGHDRDGLDHLEEAMRACTERDDAEAALRAIRGEWSVMDAICEHVEINGIPWAEFRERLSRIMPGAASQRATK